MCGIAGIALTDRNISDLATSVVAMTGVMRHRGPDDEGYLFANSATQQLVPAGGYDTDRRLALQSVQECQGAEFDLALGFRRLAILDLSPAGHQPMPSADGRFWIVFNGEVYNYQELREILAGFGYRFRSKTDTEVILAAYDRWGPECLSHFNGMWALAIWDSRRRELFLARDRFGIKPLYYAVGPGGRGLVFASEIKALFASRLIAVRPCQWAIGRYAVWGLLPSPRQGDTFFEGVHALPPGHYAVLTPERLALQRWWYLPEPAEETSLAFEEACLQYSELFTDAVRLRLQADVPVGTCLSGGLDSSSIVAAASRIMRDEHGVLREKLGEKQQTFSAVYSLEGPWNEKAHINRVLAHTGAAGNFVVPTGERLEREFERLIWHQEEPFGSTSIFAQWCVMDLARQRGVTVLLDGQGADEVLAGYPPDMTVHLRELVSRGWLIRAWKAGRAATHATGVNGWALFKGAIKFELLHRSGRNGYAHHAGLENDIRMSGFRPELGRELMQLEKATLPRHLLTYRRLDEFLRSQIDEDSLPHLLRFEDRNSMAFSLEARVPFLDYRVVEFAFRHGADYRIRAGWTKWLQRVTVENLLPAEITWRPDKVGFATPEQRWLGDWAPKLIEYFDAQAAVANYLDIGLVRGNMAALLARGETSQVWRWINLAVWLDVYTRPSRPAVHGVAKTTPLTELPVGL